MRSTFKVLFFLKRDKEKANGNVPLFCRITVDGQEVRFGMKCDVNPQFWDVKSGKASGRTTDAVKINSLIENTKAAIHKIYRELQERDNYVTAERVRNVFLGATIKHQTILEVFDKHNRERKSQVGISICLDHYETYCRTRRRLGDFIEQYYNVSDMPLRELNTKFIEDFKMYLIVNYNLSHNSLATHWKNVRHIISVAIDNDYIIKNPFANFKMQYISPGRDFLTQQELENLMSFNFTNKKYEQARDVFIFCCFTGLAYIDVFSLTKDNIKSATDGKLWIKGNRIKTKVEYNIPLLNIPKIILKKYDNKLPNGKLLPIYAKRAYNNTLKKVAKQCGIEKNISSHLARHTFATTIALTKGVPIETVSKMLGHTSIKTTQIYAKVINSKISNDMDMLAEKLSDMETKLAVNF